MTEYKNNENLIYDLGFYNGDDTNFYLKMGYKVIALEANKNLFEEGIKRFKKEIDNGQLILINKAIHHVCNEVDFYIHTENLDWCSCDINMFKNDIEHMDKLVHTIVKTINLYELYYIYGIPYYMKVDVEGCDTIVAKHLSRFNKKPKYVSFELSKDTYFDILLYLHISGYTKFQLINQLNNVNRRVPEKHILEKYKDFTFTKYSSGLFGEHLKNDKWVNIYELMDLYVMYKTLKSHDNEELGIGWVDVHAMLE